jgi:hypothetical protein
MDGQSGDRMLSTFALDEKRVFSMHDLGIDGEADLSRRLRGANGEAILEVIVMGLSSETVHHLGGVAFVLVASLLLLGHARVLRGAWLPALLPALFIGYGAESFLDPWIHGARLPGDYGHEARQHLVQGSALFVAGAIEALAQRGILKATGWRLAVPLGLAILAVFFLVHAQHEVQVDPLVLAVQHRMFAVTLFAAAATRGVAAVSRSESLRWMDGAWLVLLLVFGIELIVYTEGGSATGHLGHGG